MSNLTECWNIKEKGERLKIVRNNDANVKMGVWSD